MALRLMFAAGGSGGWRRWLRCLRIGGLRRLRIQGRCACEADCVPADFAREVAIARRKAPAGKAEQDDEAGERKGATAQVEEIHFFHRSQYMQKRGRNSACVRIARVNLRAGAIRG